MSLLGRTQLLRSLVSLSLFRSSLSLSLALSCLVVVLPYGKDEKLMCFSELAPLFSLIYMYVVVDSFLIFSVVVLDHISPISYLLSYNVFSPLYWYIGP